MILTKKRGMAMWGGGGNGGGSGGGGGISSDAIASFLAPYARMAWVTEHFLGIHDTADAAKKLETARTLWGQSFDGTGNVTGSMSSVGDIQCTAGSRIHANGSALYIGNSNDSNWVYMSDMCSRQGDSYWKIPSSGNAVFANVFSNGYLNCLNSYSSSDIRYKDVKRKFSLDAETIAKASLIQFEWKDREGDGMHVGGIAQEWAKILPEAVVENERGRLSMDYGVIAYTSAISLARKVVDMQKEIDHLKALLDNKNKRT